MSELVANCPRCGVKNITFDLVSAFSTHAEYGWQKWLEAFCICRHCNRSTVFVLSQKDLKFDVLIKQGLEKFPRAVNSIVSIERHINIKDHSSDSPPEHLPKRIEAVFREGSTCLSLGCFNAAGTMFRLCLDLATKPMLPDPSKEGPNEHEGKFLGARIKWLFKNKVLPENLADLSTSIKDDGNDGAHAGNLREKDARDILDFTFALLERIYTEPKKIEMAKQRRAIRQQE